MTTANAAEQLALLATDYTLLRRRVDTLAEKVDKTSQDLADLPALTKQVQALAEQLNADQPDKHRLWDWAVMDRAQAEQAWQALTAWVDQVLAGLYRLIAPDQPNGSADGLARLGLSEDTEATKSKRALVPSCWAQHPDVVAELSWAAQLWLQTYRTGAAGPGRAAADWHDRYLPGLLVRINQSSTTAGCQTFGHSDPPAPADPSPERAAAITADLNRRAPGLPDRSTAGR